MSTAVVWSKSKPELEFQYGRRFGEFNGMSSRSLVSHCRVLPPGEFRMWHCVSVCASGKKTAWKVWVAYDEFTDAYIICCCSAANTWRNRSFQGIFTILMYDRTATCASINDVRKLLFTCKGREMSTLPPL